jgi:hypothetical protein
VILIAAWAGKEKPPNPWQGERQRLFRGDRAINGNRVRAQGPKGKVRTVSESPKRGPECFTTKFAKFMAKGMVMAADAGYSLKVERSQGGDAAEASATPLEGWLKERNARSS